MLYQNLENKEFREHFESLLSESLGCKVECRELNVTNTSYIFVCNGSSILSVDKKREDIFTPHAPEHGPKIQTLIENFNKLCNRHIKIEQLCI